MAEEREADVKNGVFKDNKGRVWSLALTVGKAMRLRDELGIDVGKILDDENKLLNDLIQEPWQLVEILVSLTRERRESIEVDDQDFCEALTGDVLDDASIAFIYGVALSLPKLKRRALMATADRIFGGLDVAATKIEEVIRREGAKLEATLDQEIAKLTNTGN